MGSVIGEILPLALGIAISPIPIMAAIDVAVAQGESHQPGFHARLDLRHRRCADRLRSAGLDTPAERIRRAPADRRRSQDPARGADDLPVLRQWRARPHDDVEPPMPTWMSAI